MLLLIDYYEAWPAGKGATGANGRTYGIQADIPTDKAAKGVLSMTAFCGWAGTILNIDLTAGKIEKEPLSLPFAQKYLGASGFNSAKLFELVKPEVDALSPANVLMFGAGPLSGTLAPGSARLTITAKSPLTDIFGDSNMGGFFATELKFAGYDQIVVFGKAKNPVYLWIDDDKVELRDASRLWGKSTWEAARMIKEEVGDPDLQVVCIGQAGENLVRFANVMTPTKRAAGRAGMGAVMGSKNLKAIAVRGSRDIAIARPAEFAQTCSEMRQYVINNHPSYPSDRDLGTPALMDRFAPHGEAGVRNFQRNLMGNWEAISGRTFNRDFSMSKRACPACFIACIHFHNVKSGEFAGVYGEGPEFGMTCMGLRCEIDNMPALLKIHELFNQYGMDTLSAQQMMSWAMECYERGILSRKDFDGTPLTFGDYHACIEMIPRIASREGFGNILAEGEKRAPQLVGKSSEKFMYHVKGQGQNVQDPRAHKRFGLQFLTSTRGSDHLKGMHIMMYLLKEGAIGEKLWGDLEIPDVHSSKGKGLAVKWCEDIMATVNASGMCMRTPGSVQLLARALSSATGIDFSEKELLQIGERIYNIQKAFNSRQGLTREDDNFSNPEKFTQEPLREGSCEGSVFERDMMLDEYYETREWDQQTGLQTKKKLHELELDYVAEELEKTGAIK